MHGHEDEDTRKRLTRLPPYSPQRACLLALLALPVATGAPPNPSTEGSVPLFAHVRWANFSAAEVTQLARFRSVTVQVEPDAPLPCEAQAADVRAKLRAAGSPIPVLFYTNLFFSEPNCAYNAAVAENPWLWLNSSSGDPYLPGGRYTFNMAVPGAPAWWVAHVAGAAGVDGGFGDSGCGSAPAWLNNTSRTAFTAGQAAAHAGATYAAWGNGSDGNLWVANCPILPAIGDEYIPGTRGEMIESWCSDFFPGGSGTASFCRDELSEAVVLGAWGNVTLQARYYLNRHNAYNPEFGLAAFLVAAWPGSYFGASVDWDWAGDWEKLLAWPWASRAPGNATSPPRMLDPDGCTWAREYSRANVTVGFCGKHLSAQILWANNGPVDRERTDVALPTRGNEGDPRPCLPSPTPPHARPARRVVTLVPSPGVPCPTRYAEVDAPWAVGSRACLGLAPGLHTV
jgi:hypothetical protein